MSTGVERTNVLRHIVNDHLWNWLRLQDIVDGLFKSYLSRDEKSDLVTTLAWAIVRVTSNEYVVHDSFKTANVRPCICASVRVRVCGSESTALIAVRWY